MRQAINNLQSTWSGFGFVSPEAVFKVCDLPHPVTINKMIASCEKGEIDGALASLDELWSQGYSAVDIVTTIFRVVKNNDTMPEYRKLEFIKVSRRRRPCRPSSAVKRVGASITVPQHPPLLCSLLEYAKSRYLLSDRPNPPLGCICICTWAVRPPLPTSLQRTCIPLPHARRSLPLSSSPSSYSPHLAPGNRLHPHAHSRGRQHGRPARRTSRETVQDADETRTVCPVGGLLGLKRGRACTRKPGGMLSLSVRGAGSRLAADQLQSRVGAEGREGSAAPIVDMIRNAIQGGHEARGRDGE